jgi:hypothetical protein
MYLNTLTEERDSINSERRLVHESGTTHEQDEGGAFAKTEVSTS